MASDQPKPHQPDSSAAEHYVSPRKQRAGREQQENIQPPLTPMIDVTFQLLLYFLLTSTFRQKEGTIPGALPAPSNQVTEKMDLKPIEIYIEPGGTVDNTGVTYRSKGVSVMPDPERLFGFLEGRKQQFDTNEIPVVLRPSGLVRWKYVVEAFNAAVRLQFKNITIAEAS